MGDFKKIPASELPQMKFTAVVSCENSDTTVFFYLDYMAFNEKKVSVQIEQRELYPTR